MCFLFVNVGIYVGKEEYFIVTEYVMLYKEI